MYHVSAQGVDEHMITVHYYYLLLEILPPQCLVEQYSEPVASTWNLVWHFCNSVNLTNSVLYKLTQSISIHCTVDR